MKTKAKDGMGRREFLGKAAFAALTVPAALHAGSGPARGEEATAPATVQKKSAGPMKKIAIEEHWATKELSELSAKTSKGQKNAEWRDPKAFSVSFPKLWDFEKMRLPMMDDLGITVQVLSISHNVLQQLTDAETSIPLARRINNTEAEFIRSYPGRFAGFASLPTAAPEEAAKELERAVTKLEFKGAMINGHSNWHYLDEPQYRVIWERAAALGVPIYLHPNEPSAESAKIYDGYTELMGPTWAWGVETATHALRIIVSGIFDEFPTSTLILGHMGESLPYLLGRLDEGYAMCLKGKKLKKPVSEYIRENVMITTSGLYRPEALLCAMAALGADRILYAVDYPFADPAASMAAFEKTPMSDADREKIFHGNAERVLKL